ncbi:methyltransferase, TIGR04325 family [Pseudooceanicola sp. LIPI14-2-Ac024]|uniref:methyltransferase, TIGR04325 family n=1 Tax=Pseudooceanicola sp. LIPI14-2-Ac024 TaxID=3344875 RepID=UPI0035CEEFCD
MTQIETGQGTGLGWSPRQVARRVQWGLGAAGARLRTMTPRGPRFAGAYPDRTAALAALPANLHGGYDDEALADVSFPQMCTRTDYDYPLVFWLDRLLPEARVVIDAGGHLGTKYIAFAPLLDLGRTDWVVYDLPGIVAAARRRQAAGDLPAAITFASDPGSLPAADLFLASGLLQYLDRPFADLLAALPVLPRHILLNKVATRDGPELFTIERIGHGRVPYRIRNRAAFEAELDALGYTLQDSWEIGELSHVIPTHPWHGRSASRGYLLSRAE